MLSLSLALPSLQIADVTTTFTLVRLSRPPLSCSRPTRR